MRLEMYSLELAASVVRAHGGALVPAGVASPRNGGTREPTGKATRERVGTMRNLLRRLRDSIIMPAAEVPADWRLSGLDRLDGRTDPLAADPLWGSVADADHEHLRRVIGAPPLGVRDVWSNDPDRMTRRGGVSHN